MGEIMLERIRLVCLNSNKELTQKIAEILDVPVMDSVVTTFADGEILFEGKQTNSISVGFKSDRKGKELVYNEWLNQEIVYFENELENGYIEYETLLTVDENVYYFSGIMPEEEFIKIIKNFVFKTS